ncbi:MAG TPA: prepilin-type N-terminal cleavage/methylation domain-containing protein [Candidatus Binatia bacterium]|jgi:prepilin-type N-terminal cleavage/methylation domain-containing protein
MARTGNSARAGREAGFTLLELLVAASVASIGFLGLAALHANSIRTAAVGRNITAATGLAQEEIEIMRRTPASSLTNLGSQNVVVGGVTYARSATVAGVGPGTAQQVTVNVGWNDQFGAHTFALVSVIGQ